MTQDARFPHLGCAAALAIPLLMFLATCASHVWEYERDRMPNQIRLGDTLFSQDRSMGIGPGANETGLYVYELDNHDATRLIKLSRSLNSDSRIRSAVGTAEPEYYEWKRTPILTFDTQPSSNKHHKSSEAARKPSISDFLGRYGLYIDVDPTVQRSINEVISAPGSYYAKGRAGALIIVSPHRRRVIFAYAG